MTITPIKDDAHWHELRNKTIGGSEVGIVFGVSSYSTLNELFHVKRGNYKEDLEGSKLMQWGKAMEPVIAAFISGEMYWDLVPCKEYHQHPEHPHLGSTLDYHVVQSEHGPGLLEIKNVSTFSPEWTQTRAPNYCELQLQHQFLTVNAARQAAGLPTYKWGCIGSMHAGNPEDIRIMYRKPDPKVHAHIIKKVGEFWQDVQDCKEPDLMGHKEYEHIAAMFGKCEDPPAEQEIIDSRGDALLDDLICRHENAKHDKSVADKEQKMLKAKILHHLMVVSPEGVTKRIGARTDNYGVETKVVQTNRKAQPAKQGTQLRFTIREV